MKVPLLSESRDTWPGLRMKVVNSKKSGCETWDDSKNKKNRCFVSKNERCFIENSNFKSQA